MKTGLIVVVTLIAGVLLASAIMEDPGYVVVNFRGYILEMSVPILILGILAMYFLVRVLHKLLRAPRLMGAAAGRYRLRRAHKQLASGLQLIAEGNWSRGERLLTRGARHGESPLVNYLTAARAAQQQGAPERRDSWLQMAYEQLPDSRNAVLLTQAELQLEERQFDQAKATLGKLAEDAANHPRRLQLLMRLYSETGNWRNLVELLPRLKHKHLLSADETRKLALRAHGEVLREAGTQKNAEWLGRQWQAVPRELRNTPELFKVYMAALMACGKHQEAEGKIRSWLKSQWDGEVVGLYGALEIKDEIKHLARAESWLTARSEDPDLLLAVARICMRSELWGKARSYLETSLAIRPTVGTYQLYGKLLEEVGEGERAAEAFRSGLLLATDVPEGGPPALEAPEETKSQQASG